jgi:hypothetical protein
MSKCTMTGCGNQPEYRVVLALPSDVAGPGGEMDKGSLVDAAVFPACESHVDHIAKVFYSAAYALNGTVTTDQGESVSSRVSVA